jgi:hypothetical protein
MIEYLEKLNKMLNVNPSNDDDYFDFFLLTTEERFNIILKALNTTPQLSGTGNYNNGQLIYSLGDEYLHTIIKQIETPILLFEYYNIIHHPYSTDRYCDSSTIEQQIYMWDYNSEKKVFLIHYNYGCEYHKYCYYIINISTQEDFIKKMDENEQLRFIGNNKENIISNMKKII